MTSAAGAVWPRRTKLSSETDGRTPLSLTHEILQSRHEAPARQVQSRRVEEEGGIHDVDRSTCQT